MCGERHPKLAAPGRCGGAARSGGILALLLLTLLAFAGSAKASEDGGVDPSLALWGASAIGLIFTVGGGLAMAQYHRAVGAVDGRLNELRAEGQSTRELLARTREDYARRAEVERINVVETTLRTEMRSEIGAMRTEMRTELGKVDAKIGDVQSDLQKILALMEGRR